ncbi:MAG: ArsR/SmtB family transcription factor [Gemmatimonadota bacterium]
MTEILKAVGNPTRRTLLTMLAQQGPTRVTDLAACFDMSLNAVSKHIKVLEEAGLVRRETEWREHLIDVNLEPLSEVRRWLGELRSIWEMRLEALDHVLTEETDDDRAEE